MKNLLKMTSAQNLARFCFRNFETMSNVDDFKLDLADLKSESEKPHEGMNEYANSLLKNGQEQQKEFNEEKSTENIKNEINNMEYDFDGVLSNETKSSEAFVEFVISEAKKLNIKIIPPDFLSKYLGKYEEEFTKKEGDISYRAPGNYATLGDLGMMVKKMGAIGQYNGETSKEINKKLDKKTNLVINLWKALQDLQKSE